MGLKPSEVVAVRSSGVSLPNTMVRSEVWLAAYAENLLLVAHRKRMTMTAKATMTLTASPIVFARWWRVFKRLMK